MTKHALCIGINDYPGTDGDLQGCINDANDWADELQRRGFAVQQLLDRAATRAAMMQAIGGLIDAADRGDSIVITYSGHGTWVPDSSGDEPDGRDEGLCPHDLATAGPLLDDELHALFSRRTAGVRLVLISDSCHSGSVIRAPGLEQDVTARVRFLPPEAWMGSTARLATTGRTAGGLSRTGGDLLLAGCRDTEYSWDASFQGRPNGAFTYHALKALKDARARTYSSWFGVIREALPSTSAPQTPQLFGTATARGFRVFS